MRLSCNATTPQELREEIVSLLLHRATQQRQLKSTTAKIGDWHKLDAAADALENLAGEIKCMQIDFDNKTITFPDRSRDDAGAADPRNDRED